jgi:Ca2+-binding RTX toxin-like protein
MGVWTPGPGATGGNDTYEGDGANEIVDGLGGNDILRGRGGGDTLTGGDGDDTLLPGDDYLADTITGGDGFDTIDYSEISEDGIYLDISGFFALRNTSATNDTITGIEAIIGTATGDVLAGVEGQSIINGGDGNDFLIGRNAQLTGGAGTDFFAVFDYNNTITDFEVGIDFITNGSITLVNEAGGDTFLTFSTGAVFQIVGVTGLTLAQWQENSASGWFIDNAGGSDTDTQFGGAQFLFGAGGDDTLNGAGGDDTIYGGPGADTLLGASGADLVDGGSGDDILVVNDSGSFINETLAGGSGTDTLRLTDTGSSQQYILSQAIVSSIERFEFASTLGDFAYAHIVQSQFGAGFSTALNVVGSALIDQFEISMTSAGTFSLAGFTFTNWEYNDLTIVGGTTAADNIIGSSTSDWLLGSGGDDIITGGGGDDDLRGMEENDALSGGEGGDRLHGGAGTDTLLGNNGNDTLRGGEGADVIDGGANTDEASYLDSSAAVSINLATNSASGGEAAGDTLISIENVRGSAWDDVLVGSSGVNTLSGGDGADTLTGGLNGDIVSGGAGADTIVYAIGDGADAIDGGADIDTLNLTDGAASNLLNVSYDGSTLTAIAGSSLTGVENINVNMGGGTDWLIYSATAAVTVNLGTGVASGGFTAIAGVERVIGGAGNDSLTGDGADNRLDGSAGDDTLNGAAGVDTLIGGDGADHLSGGLGNDSLQGGIDDDEFNWVVGDGRDTIDGGVNFDTFNAAGLGAAELGNATWNGTSITALMDNALTSIEAIHLNLAGGIDWLIYSASAAVTVNLATNSASGFASVTNIEKVIGGSGNDTLTGDGLDNRLDGQSGADTLDGGAGSDAILGGDGADIIYASAGNDSLQGQNGNDTFHWTSTDGRDTFNGGADTDTVNFTGSAVADVADATWNGSAVTALLNNALISIELINLDLGAGGAGGDWLRYNTALGVSVNLATGVASGFASITGVENLIGGTGGDTLIGDGGVNKINGNNGDDVITGGGGADNLTGGAGNDTFVYAAGAGNDTIIDFDAWAVGGQDFLDVSAFGINAGNFAARVAIIDTGADTVVRIDNTYFITLKNVTGDGDNVITDTDFIFGP